MKTADTSVEYNDNDFVYVDVPQKKVIGLVEWDATGNAQKKEVVFTEETTSKEDPKRRRRSKRYYPWCSYITAKKVYNIEGKYNEKDQYDAFNTVLEKALKEPYWARDSIEEAETE